MRVPSPSFWQGRRVLVTGHTGFKGAWLTLWLSRLGAQVSGYALPPGTSPSLFRQAGLEARMASSALGDIRDRPELGRRLREAAPEIVLHLAAQALVRPSYADPLGTYETNVMGTANLLEAVRSAPSVRAVVNVTTDKCYANREHPEAAYAEDDPLGGYDPYSSSKACSELVTAAYRSSFFNPADYARHRTAIATARAGNVIGGGDWAEDRLVPDCVRALQAGRPVEVRRPEAVRPWQHVLDPLCGYLLLAERLVAEGPAWGEAWNFGPDDAEARRVDWVVQSFCSAWGQGERRHLDPEGQPHEAGWLRIDSRKARRRLGWASGFTAAQAVGETAREYQALLEGADAAAFLDRQIAAYTQRATPCPN